MVKLINRLTGTEMWVADSRLEEYLRAGHVPALSPAEEPKKEQGKTEKKATTKKK